MSLNFPSIKRAGRDPSDTDIQLNFLYFLGLTGAIAHPANSRRAATKYRGNQWAFCELRLPEQQHASAWQKGSQKL
jgi:hypothetical protein